MHMTDIDITAVFEFSPGQGLPDIQAEYQDKLYAAMSDYLQSSQPITSFRNAFRRAVNDAFTFSFVAGWADAGASGPITPEAQSWLDERIGTELLFSDAMFDDLKRLRSDKEIPMEDKLAAAEAHAAAYTSALYGLYSQGGLMAAPEIDLTFDGEDGASDSICQSIGGTCVRLMGQTHPASWWVKNGLVPAHGNNNYDCGGWNCRHKLVDKKGNVWASADGEGL
jgi:hypothetical protein